MPNHEFKIGDIVEHSLYIGIYTGIVTGLLSTGKIQVDFTHIKDGYTYRNGVYPKDVLHLIQIKPIEEQVIDKIQYLYTKFSSRKGQKQCAA